MKDSNENSLVRLDRWLWAARIFKTRAQATAAVRGGRVHLNGQRVKPAHRVRVDDVVDVSKGQSQFELAVAGLSDRRGPARVAQALYAETDASVARREAARVAAQDGAHMHTPRPDKRSRRLLRRLAGKR